MAQFVSGAHIGTSAVRKDFYLNARDANGPKDNIRGQEEEEDESVQNRQPSCWSWLRRRPKVRLRIRKKYSRQRQFRWKKIKPDYS